MNESNLDIKKQIKKMGCNLYEVGAKMGMSPGKFSLYLVSDLTEAEKKDVLFYARAVRRKKYGTDGD